jgi:hypothetical protein
LLSPTYSLPIYFTGFCRRMKPHKAAHAAQRHFLIIFDILIQEMLLTEEATIAVDSQSEICWETDWKNKPVFKTEKFFLDNAKL